MSPQPIPLPAEITPAPLPLPRALAMRQASIVTQTIVASTGISDPANNQSSSSSGGFPVAVAVPALIGGMALALLGALGWWYWQRRKRREQKVRASNDNQAWISIFELIHQRRWEARQKRNQRKRANSSATNTARPSISGSRPTNGRSAPSSGGMSEKEKHGAGGLAPPLPPVATLNKEYGYDQQQQQHGGYSYPMDQYGRPLPVDDGYDAYDQNQNQYGQNPVQPSIDNYGASSDPFNQPLSEQDQPEEYKPNGPAPAPSTSKTSSRGAKRVEAAENAAAREQADPMTRYRPNKPSPLALAAAEKKRLEAESNAAMTLSPTSGYNNRASMLKSPQSTGSNWEYQEELTTPNDPDYTSRRSEDYGASSGGNGRQVSGQWGVAGGTVESSGYSADGHQSGAYVNDPYLSTGGNGEESHRAPSGQYTTDPYAGYHGGAVGDGYGGKKAKVGGWV